MGDVGCRVARVWEGTLMHPLESDFDPWRGILLLWLMVGLAGLLAGLSQVLT